jgi:hypothetical protein
MKSRTTTTPPDFDTLYNNLLAQMGGPVEVDTPQLGRVAFPRPAELYQALNYLRMAQAASSGTAVTGVITIGHDRGLWPCKEGSCCCNEEFYPAR